MSMPPRKRCTTAACNFPGLDVWMEPEPPRSPGKLRHRDGRETYPTEDGAGYAVDPLTGRPVPMWTWRCAKCGARSWSGQRAEPESARYEG